MITGHRWKRARARQLGRRFCGGLLAIATALLVVAASASAQSVTLGPQLPVGTGIGVGCSPVTDCSYVNATLPAGVIAKAPSSGTITTWRVETFDGSAQLVVWQAGPGGTYTVVRKSAVVNEPCDPSDVICGPWFRKVFTFSTNLPITAGQYIGIELISASTCESQGAPCTSIGYWGGTVGSPYTPAAYQTFGPTPPIGTPTAPNNPGGQPGQGAITVNADETTKSVAASLSPAKLTADGHAQTTATAKVTDGGSPVSTDTVAFTSSDAGNSIGPVTNDGNGTYTATITSSHTVGHATITATDTSDTPGETGTATLTQLAPTLGVAVKPGKIPADGKSSATVTVKLTGIQGEPVAGEHVAVQAAGPGIAGFVQDGGNGTYTASVTATHAAGKVTVTATDDSVSPAVSRSTSLTTTPVLCKVPKLAGDTLMAAKQALTKANCAAGKVTTKYSKARKGKVISSSPSAGSQRPFGTSVALIVSNGAKRKGCVVPKLKGDTLAAAKRALRRANCKVGRITRKASHTIKKGLVISTSPERASHKKRGAAVKLVISRGKH